MVGGSIDAEERRQALQERKFRFFAFLSIYIVIALLYLLTPVIGSLIGKHIELPEIKVAGLIMVCTLVGLGLLKWSEVAQFTQGINVSFRKEEAHEQATPDTKPE